MYSFGSQATLSYPGDQELHMLSIDLATGTTEPHNIPNIHEGGSATHRMININDRMAVTSSDRAADDPKGKKMT